MGESSDLLYRLFEIEVKSATIAAAADGGSFYVRISVAGKELQTKHSQLRNDVVSWGQRFVVSVPESFISDERSSVCLTLFKARMLLSDVALGQVSCAVMKHFPVVDCLNYVGEGRGTEYKEPEIQEQEIFELRAAVDRAPVMSSGEYLYSPEREVAGMDFSVCAWRRFFPYELNLRGRLEKRYPIIDGDMKVGKLTMRWPAPEFSPLYACSYCTEFNRVDLAVEFGEMKDAVLRRRRSMTAAAMVENPAKPPRRLFCFA